MTQSATVAPVAAPEVRWPGVIGTIGIVVGVLMIVDKLDDLLVPLALNEDFWNRLLAPDLAEFVNRVMPPRSWLVASSLAGVALGALLLVGSLRLRRRLRSGVALSRIWAWIAIVWLAAESVRIVFWFGEFGDELTRLAGSGWEALAYAGIVVAMAVLLAYPVFLLVWFSRPAVKAELRGWRD